MCGRFTIYHTGREIAARFHLPEVPELQPRYNVAPTQQILTIRKDGVTSLRWGLRVPWSAGPLTNARSETVATKPAFRAAFRERRCLVPADGFFEWKTEGKHKQPCYFTVNDGALFAIAAIWQDDCVALLTTEANGVVGPVHDRMPVILPPEALERWLTSTDSLAELLIPYAGRMNVRMVGSTVGNARNEGPRCIEELTAVQKSLF